MSQSSKQNVMGDVTTENNHCQLKKNRHLLYPLILLKNIQAVIFFLNLQTFNYILVNAYAVLFKSNEKYADSQKHTLEKKLFFWKRMREREKFAMEYEIYEA